MKFKIIIPSNLWLVLFLFPLGYISILPGFRDCSSFLRRSDSFGFWSVIHKELICVQSQVLVEFNFFCLFTRLFYNNLWKKLSFMNYKTCSVQSQLPPMWMWFLPFLQFLFCPYLSILKSVSNSSDNCGFMNVRCYLLPSYCGRKAFASLSLNTASPWPFHY